MMNLRTFLNTVSAVITMLDAADQCDLILLVDSTASQLRCTSDEASEVLGKMERARLIVSDVTRENGWNNAIVAITAKGRMLAADIRQITGKVIT